MVAATAGRAWLEADSPAAEFTATSAAAASMAVAVDTAVVGTGKFFPSAV